MHSNLYESLNENQKEYSLSYNYFVNSQKEEDIFNFLDYYEKNILLKKENGNVKYTNHLYENPILKNQFENKEAIKIDGQFVKLKNIIFIIMDKSNPKSKSDYYHFFYKKMIKLFNQIIQKSHLQNLMI